MTRSTPRRCWSVPGWAGVSAGVGRQQPGSGPGGPPQRTVLADGDVVVLFSDGLGELTRLAQAATAGRCGPPCGDRP